MEDDGPEARAWDAAQDDEARRYLKALPAFDHIVRAVRHHMSACHVAVPVAAGDRWFSLAGGIDQPARAVTVGSAPDGSGTSIAIASDLDPREEASIDWLAPSPDGERLAIGVSAGGDEQSVLRLIEVDDGRVLPDAVAHVVGGSVAWLPSGRALYCLAGETPDAVSLRKKLALVAPGRSVTWAELPETRSRRQALQVSPGGELVGLLADPAAPRLSHVLDRRTGAWTEVVPPSADCVLCGVFAGSRYVAVTTDGAPRGRLVSAQLDDLSRSGAWRELVPEGQDVLRAVTLVGKLLVLCSFGRGRSRLGLVTDAGRRVGDVPLPGRGLVARNGIAPAQYGGVPPVQADAEGLTFTFSTMERSPALLRHTLSTGETRILRPPAIVLDGIAAESRSCAAPDGWRVDYEVIARHDAATPAPTLVIAYGGWNAMTTAQGYAGRFAPVLEAGGRLVFVHARGDGTMGVEQWRSGRRLGKQRSFDDVYAVADDLVARGDAGHSRLGLWGASNGGLLAGAAIVQRPELFRVVVAVAPLLDMCRFLRDRFGEHLAREYGDPRRLPDARVLRSYSPYHNVRAGVRYPATLVVCGAGDARTPVWHGRKMVAAMRAATAGDGRILLRVHPQYGHVTTTDLAPAWMVAEWLAFAMSEIGLGAPRPSPAPRGSIG